MTTRKIPNKTLILIVIMLGQFICPFLANALNIALPQIGIDFNMDAISLGWVVAMFIIASTIFIIPFGRLADIWGMKKMYTIGIGGIAAG